MKKSNKITIGICSCILVVGLIGSIAFNNSNKNTNKNSTPEKITDLQADTAISAYSNESKEIVEEPSFLLENNDSTITKLVADYYDAILNADKKAYDAVTIDENSMEVDVMLRKMEYIEGYDNQKIYVTQGIDNVSLVVYVVYDLKIHTIDTPAPSIDQLLIKNVKGKPKLYFNELTAKETKQLENIRNHEEVVDLIQSVDQRFVQAIETDSNLNDFYKAISAKR